MVRCCAEHGYDLLISFQQLSSDWHVDYEDSRKADGIILLGYGDYLEYRPRLEQLIAARRALSCAGARRTKARSERPFRPTTNRAASMRRRILLQQGRRRIAFIGTGGRWLSRSSIERWRGYCRALHAAGIEPDERLRVDAAPRRERRAERGRTVARSAASSSTPSSPRATSRRSARCTRSSTRAVKSLRRRSSASTTFPQRALQARRSPPLRRTRGSRGGGAGRYVRSTSIETGFARDRVLPVRLTVRELSVARLASCAARAQP